MRTTRIFAVLTCLTLSLGAATAGAQGSEGPLRLSVVKVKPKGSWTEVTVAVENTAQKDLEFKCCTTYLETANGFAVASLDRKGRRHRLFSSQEEVARLEDGSGGAFEL